MRSTSRIFFTVVSVIVLCTASVRAQKYDTAWTTKDKQFLIDNYERVKAEVNKETKDLTVKQWNFREKEGSWTVAEVIEHLNMWALVTQEHERFMRNNGKQIVLAMTAPSDSANTSFIYEEKLHTSPDFTIPTGQIPDRANLNVFNVYHDRIITNIKKSNLNFRLYLRTFTSGYMSNLNQAYIIHFGHVDRHLRQVRRIKSNAAFPKK